MAVSLETIRKRANDVADVARTHAAANDAEARFPEKSVRALGDAGMLGLIIPEELGGLGLGPAAVAEVVPIIAEADASATKVQDAVEAYMQDQSDAIRFIAGVEGIDLFVATASDIQAQIGQAFDQVTLFIAAIAGVSLVVGGVMIGTIMLISVTERTKEIGVMKAIGGRDRDILWLFLLEAAIIGVIGSIIGIAIGLGGGAALLGVIPGLDGVSFVFPWDWVGYSILVGIGTGILAGFFPARRATKVQPVEALSYE